MSFLRDNNTVFSVSAYAFRVSFIDVKARASMTSASFRCRTAALAVNGATASDKHRATMYKYSITCSSACANVMRPSRITIMQTIYVYRPRKSLKTREIRTVGRKSHHRMLYYYKVTGRFHCSGLRRGRIMCSGRSRRSKYLFNVYNVRVLLLRR